MPSKIAPTMEYDKRKAEAGLEVEANPLDFATVERLRRNGGRNSAKKRNTATDDDNEHREEKMAEVMTTTT